MSDIKDILNRRRDHYGDFSDIAELTTRLRDHIYRYDSFHSLPYVHREAIMMILVKLARAVLGKPSYKDNFIDIIGYAKLVVDFIDSLEAAQTNTDNSNSQNI